MGPGLALKASLKASVLAASIIVSGSSFHSLTDLGESYIYIYISPATSIYKFKWVVICCLEFRLTEVPYNSENKPLPYNIHANPPGLFGSLPDTTPISRSPVRVALSPG